MAEQGVIFVNSESQFLLTQNINRNDKSQKTDFNPKIPQWCSMLAKSKSPLYFAKYNPLFRWSYLGVERCSDH